MKSSRLPINNHKSAWILVDEGHTFQENQALAIMEAMDLPSRLYLVSEGWIWRYIPSWIGPNPVSRIHSNPPSLRAPWPSFVICGGKVALKIGAYLKKQHNTYAVALGDGPKSFDKIILENSILIKQGNSIITCGPLHRIHPEHLREARKTNYRKIDHLLKPRIGLFFEGGGNLEELICLLHSHHKKAPFSLMIYGKDLSEEDQKLLAHIGIPQVLWVGEGCDPYLGFLAHSDGIIVSSASPQMMAEVSSLGKIFSVYLTDSMDPYTHALLDKGLAIIFSENSSLIFGREIPFLQEAQRVANILKEDNSFIPK